MLRKKRKNKTKQQQNKETELDGESPGIGRLLHENHSSCLSCKVDLSERGKVPKYRAF